MVCSLNLTVNSAMCKCRWTRKVMAALVVLPKIRAIRSIPSSACVRRALEMRTCLAVNSTSMVSPPLYVIPRPCLDGESTDSIANGFGTHEGTAMWIAIVRKWRWWLRCDQGMDIHKKRRLCELFSYNLFILFKL